MSIIKVDVQYADGHTATFAANGDEGVDLSKIPTEAPAETDQTQITDEPQA